MSKTPKPIIHRRDHEHGGADPVRITWESTGTGGGGGQAVFALTGLDAAFVADGDEEGLIGDHFSTTDSTVFATNGDGSRAHILVPGFYQIRCQASVFPQGSTLAVEAAANLKLAFFDASSSECGYSIEIPWYVSGFNSSAGFASGEQMMDGSRFVFPSGSNGGSWDIALERLHPISLLSSSFPVEIRPSVFWDGHGGDPGQSLSVRWLGLWGFRISDPLDSYHSD